MPFRFVGGVPAVDGLCCARANPEVSAWSPLEASRSLLTKRIVSVSLIQLVPWQGLVSFRRSDPTCATSSRPRVRRRPVRAMLLGNLRPLSVLALCVSPYPPTRAP